LVAFAKRFLQARSDAGGAAWHVRDLPKAGAELLPRSGGEHTKPKRASAAHPYGILAQRDGRCLLSLMVPLGFLGADQVEAVIGAADREVIVTPWRGLLIPDLTHDVDRSAKSLTDVGLSVESASGWSEVSACTGAPGCNNANASTRPVAAEMVDVVRRTNGLPVHVVACERRCGAPVTEHIEIALGQGNWQVGVRSLARHHSPRGSGATTDMSALAHVVAQARNGL
jgi:precorrin-3B synthase